MIIDERFRSFLLGMATSEQIHELRARGASKRYLCNLFGVGERQLKQCERTPGDFITIKPTTWMAAPALQLPKGVHYCVRSIYKGSRSKLSGRRYFYIDPWLHHRTTDLDTFFTRAVILRRWLNGEISSLADCNILLQECDYRRKQDRANLYIKRGEIPAQLKGLRLAVEIYEDLSELSHRQLINKFFGRN